MSYNTSGIYTVPVATAWVAGQPIYAENYNVFLADLKKAVNLALNRLIKTQMKGPLPMGGHKVTNLAAAVGEYLALRYSFVFPVMKDNKILSTTISSYAAASTVVITGSTSSFLQITGTGVTINTITAATVDDQGPYYVLVRQAGVEFSLAGNVRVGSLSTAYRTKLADMLFLMTKDNTTGNWVLSALESLSALLKGHFLLEAFTDGSSILLEDGSYLLLE